jgi:hypothetical protein
MQNIIANLVLKNKTGNPQASIAMGIVAMDGED